LEIVGEAANGEEAIENGQDAKAAQSDVAV
jgi:hypothetical protein